MNPRRGKSPVEKWRFWNLLFQGALLAVLAVACSQRTPTLDSAVVGDSAILDLVVDDAVEKTDLDDPEPYFTEEETAALAKLSPQTLPPPPADITNRFADNPAAALLGQKFFFDPLFSGALLDADNDGGPTSLGVYGETGKVSCAGCHIPNAGFLDNRSRGKQISLAAGWVIRRTPSLLDVGQAKLLMWDGSKDALYNQVFGPIESRDEMNSSRLFVAQQVFARYKADYEAVFGTLPPLDDAKRFPPLTATTTGCRKKTLTEYECHGMPGDQAEYDGMSPEDQNGVTRVVVNFGKALGAYQRRLSCGSSRFDAWVHGDDTALSRAEQRGAALFVGKAKCVGCHSGPYLSDQQFHNVGLRAAYVAVVFIDDDDPGAIKGIEQSIANPLNIKSEFSDGDDGRLPEVVTQEMSGSFRTPMLRCVTMRPSFMHTGHMMSLATVISFFNRGGDPSGYYGTKEIQPLGLSDREQTDLIAFLHALSGPGPENSLLNTP